MGNDFDTQKSNELLADAQRGDEVPYCPNRRLALETFALAVGGLGAQVLLPSRADAKVFRASYPIKFVLNGGKNPGNQTLRVKRGQLISVTKLKKPHRKGYVFKGWYRNKTLTKKATVLRGVAAKSRRRIYAKWSLKRYAITYVLNGGSFAESPRSSFTIKSKTFKLPAPTRKGYTFVGWFLDRKCKRLKTSIKTGSVGEVKLYAKWQAVKYSIAYELDGGKATLDLPKNYKITSSCIEPFPPTKPGYRFVGWYADADKTKALPRIETGSTGDTKLFAKWEPVDYWDSHLAQRCGRVAALEAKRGSGPASFLFITDMHLPQNALVSPYLARRVIEETGVDTVFFGGDAMNGPVKRNDAVGMLKFIRSSFGNARVRFVRGNHDANNQGSVSSQSFVITDQDFVALTANGDEVRADNLLDYYVDDAENKIRYIVLDSGAPYGNAISAAQLDWLESRVLELGVGWGVLIFAHEIFAMYRNSSGGKYIAFASCGTLLKNRLDSIYDQVQALVLGVISGHCHRDHVEHSDKGYPFVVTTCDARGREQGADSDNTTCGTTLEQAFDVVTINMEKHKIYFTRIGSGKNRAVGFASKVVEPIDDPEQIVDDQPDDNDATLLVAGTASTQALSPSQG